MNGPGHPAPARFVDHVGIAVADADEAAARFAALLGLEIAGDEIVDDVGVRLVYLVAPGPAGPPAIPLVPPVRSGPVREHLDRYGEGPHHVCFAVRSIAETLASLPAEAGAGVFTGGRGLRACFLVSRPAGTTVELVETGPDAAAAPPDGAV